MLLSFLPLCAALLGLASLLAQARGDNLRASHEINEDPRAVIDYWTTKRIQDTVARDKNIGLSEEPVSSFLRGRDLAEFSESKFDWTKGGPINVAAGRLVYFNTDPSINQTDFCTATVICDGEMNGKSLILTAAHCVITDGGIWHKDFLFIPEQDDAGGPVESPGPQVVDFSDRNCTNDIHGCWIPQAALIDAAYQDVVVTGHLDYAILVVKDSMSTWRKGYRNTKEYRLDKAVPERRVIVTKEMLPKDFYTEKQYWHGYPFYHLLPPPPVNLTNLTKHDPNHLFCNGTVIDQGGLVEIAECPLEGGSSGGPLQTSPTGHGMIASVVSHSSSFFGRNLFGPKLWDNSFSCIYKYALTKPIPTGHKKLPVSGKVCKDIVKIIARACGDPHFKTWSGRQFDFMGACDLVLVQAPHFARGLGLEINVRTKIRYAYSYIERAAIKIGNDVLEVGSFGEYFLNGVESANPRTMSIAGFPIVHEQLSEKSHLFTIQLPDDEAINIKTHKDLVSVTIEAGDEHFFDSRGMMGDYMTGEMLARDGVTISPMTDDGMAIADEWQVRDSEEVLFQSSQFPQYPQQCVMPTPEAIDARRRKLAENPVLLADAEHACAKWSAEERAACVYDVMATGDLELADAGAF